MGALNVLDAAGGGAAAGVTDYVSPIDEATRSPEPLAVRGRALAGSRVVLLDITKNRSAQFLDRVGERLEAHGARTERVSKEIFSRPAAPELIRRIANRGDLVVEGLAD